MNPQQIIQFWFEETSAKRRFAKDSEFDRQIAGRFARTHRDATQGLLSAWRDSATGALAEVIVLDQFSRNIFRGQAEAFASDTLALVLAQEAIRRGLDEQLPAEQRAFLYMPFMHSESAEIHEQAVELFSQAGLEKQFEYELRHKKIIDRFGRYPHRNEFLGRKSSPEELKFLRQPGSSF